MNILYLDYDGPTSAEMLYDKDVIAMPIAIGQALLRVWHVTSPGKFAPVLNLAHADDPWSAWALRNQANYIELWNYGSDLIDEHWHRFGSRSTIGTNKFGELVTLNGTGYRHGMDRSMQSLQSIPPIPEADKRDELLISIADARADYKKSGHMYTHTHREVPEWLK